MVVAVFLAGGRVQREFLAIAELYKLGRVAVPEAYDVVARVVDEERLGVEPG